MKKLLSFNKVKLQSKVYPIKLINTKQAVKEAGFNFYGRTLYLNNTSFREISISDRLIESEDIYRDVLIHEICHAVLFEAGYLRHEENDALELESLLSPLIKFNNFSWIKDYEFILSHIDLTQFRYEISSVLSSILTSKLSSESINSSSSIGEVVYNLLLDNDTYKLNVNGISTDKIDYSKHFREVDLEFKMGPPR